VSEEYIPTEDVKMVEQDVIWEDGQPPRYKIKIPDFLARWDVWQVWEKERFLSMEEKLKPGDVLFDIGVESGWMAAIHGQFVGPQNVCLFESSPEFWTHIRAVWEANFDQLPAATCACLVSDQTKGTLELRPNFYASIWPPVAYRLNIIDTLKYRKYRYLHEHTHEIPQISIDDFVGQSQIHPKAIAMDVEGAELRVLQGARSTLQYDRPLVWLSAHPDLLEKDYGTTQEELGEFMYHANYALKHLATDHEVHLFFEPL